MHQRPVMVLPVIGLLLLGVFITWRHSARQAPSLPAGELLRTLTYHGKPYLVCRVDPQQYRLEAWNKQADGRPHSFASLKRLKGNELIMTINGGMYDPNLQPLGLFVTEGQTLYPLNLDTLSHGNFFDLPAGPGQHPNGVFGVDRQEKAFLVLSDHYPAHATRTRIATQSGPVLVLGGRLNAHFTAASKNCNIRNGVGIDTTGAVLLVLSRTEVTFHELATFFRDGLHCPNALYLDGFVSAAYAPAFDMAPRQPYPLGVFLTVSRKQRE